MTRETGVPYAREGARKRREAYIIRCEPEGLLFNSCYIIRLLRKQTSRVG